MKYRSGYIFAIGKGGGVVLPQTPSFFSGTKCLLGSKLIYKIKYKSRNTFSEHHHFDVVWQIFAKFSRSKNRIKIKTLETIYDIKYQQSEQTCMQNVGSNGQ